MKDFPKNPHNPHIFVKTSLNSEEIVVWIAVSPSISYSFHSYRTLKTCIFFLKNKFARKVITALGSSLSATKIDREESARHKFEHLACKFRPGKPNFRIFPSPGPTGAARSWEVARRSATPRTKSYVIQILRGLGKTMAVEAAVLGPPPARNNTGTD